MAIIANWINDRVQSKIVDRIVEDTHTDLLAEDNVLKSYFPQKTYNDRNFMGMVVEKVRPEAATIGYDGKAPTTTAGSFKQVVEKFAKLGLDYCFTEELQFRMEEVQRMAAIQNIGVQDRVIIKDNKEVTIPGTGSQLADFIFGKAEDLTFGIQTNIDNMAWSILQSGKILRTDSRTNATISVDYRDGSATYDFFPAAGVPLTVDGSAYTPTTRTRYPWDDYTNADGILDIEEDCEGYRRVNGFYPKSIAMSKTAFRHLVRQASTINYASTFSTGVTAARMSYTILNRVLEDRGLPPIEYVDRLYDREDVNGNITKVRYLAENRYVFLAPNMGERAVGTTIESKNGLYDRPKAGIWLKTVQDPLNPVQDIMQARATALAMAINPKLLLSRQVIWTP